MVQSVERLQPEPEIEALRKPEILREGHVDTLESRAAENVSSQAPVRTQSRHGKLRRRKNAVEKLILAESRCLDGRDRGIRAIQRSTVGIVIAVRVGRAGIHAERETLLEDSVARELPSTRSLAIPGAAGAQER